MANWYQLTSAHIVGLVKTLSRTMTTGMSVTGPLRLQPIGCAEIGCRLPTQPLSLTQELTKDSLTDARTVLERHRKIIIESWRRQYNAVGRT